MKKNVRKLQFRLISIVVLFLLLLATFGVVTASATASESDETFDDSFPYGIRPYLEQFSYNVGDEIPINVVVDADCDISSFSTVYNGFVEEDAFTIVNDTIKGSMICDGIVEAPQFTITVVLENGKQLHSNVYGFVSDGTVYINVNSLFGAKDVYWSEMLASGIRTEAEYKFYMTGVESTVSTENVQIGSSASTTALTRTVTVTGILQWKDDWGNLHPLRHTKVRVFPSTSLSHILNPNHGATYTDSNGYYVMNVDVSLMNFLTLEIYPEGKNTVVKTGSGGGYVYSKTLSSMFAYCEENVIIDMSDYTGRAFQISQAVIAAAEFTEIVSGNSIDPVTVKYPHAENSMTCFYRGSERTIYVLGENVNYTNVINNVAIQPYASWDMLMHEYFHHIQSLNNISGSHGGWHSFHVNMYDHYLLEHSIEADLDCYYNGAITCANPPANLAKDYAIKLAYAEAVATVLGGISQEYLINSNLLESNIVTVGDAIYQAYNGVMNNYEDAIIRLSEANEATVAAILWDIYDDVTESQDTLELGYQAFWNLLVKNQSKTLSEFVNTFYTTYPMDHNKIAAILIGCIIAPATNYVVRNNSLYNCPNFDWYSSVVLTNSYQNVTYILTCYNVYQRTLVSKTLTETSYQLTADEWNAVLSASGDFFYWTVSAYHDDGNGCVTGPYISDYKKVTKPSARTVTLDSGVYGDIAGTDKYTWYKFVAPSSGIYRFYSESYTDPDGELFERPLYGLSSTEGRLAYDMDSEFELNFAITYELDYQQEVYIRVSGYEMHADSVYCFYVELLEHIHNYSASIQANDQFTHRSTCDCGLYEDAEHEWENLGGTTIRCIICKYRYSEQIPGGEIQSVGGGAEEIQSIEAILHLR